jgi:hypothetical protein
MSRTAPRLVQTLTASAFSPMRMEEIGVEIRDGHLVPYLGPGVLDVGPRTSVPTTPLALAMALHARAPVSAKLRGDLWATAQFIEQRRHRKTLVAFMADIFAEQVTPGPLHRWLAGVDAPLIVDAWYDGALAAAFREAGRTDFIEIQGITRAGENADLWTRAYAAAGAECDAAAISVARTVIYKPHGSVAPAQNFLVADSDYVEVLTEIDIQTPVPDPVKQRRQGRGFVFLGCRFDDQMLRTYARQIMKRSAGPHYIVLDFEPTRMEERFLTEQGIEPLAMDLATAIGAITSA